MADAALHTLNAKRKVLLTQYGAIQSDMPEMWLLQSFHYFTFQVLVLISANSEDDALNNGGIRPIPDRLVAPPKVRKMQRLAMLVRDG